MPRSGIWQRTAGNRLDSLLIILLGFFWHSAYLFFPYRPFAILFPVNESVWEHLKLGFWPVIIITLLRYRNQSGNSLIHSAAVRYLAINSTVLILFYSYTSLLGRSVVLVDILSYIVGVFVGEKLDATLWRRGPRGSAWGPASILILSAALFAWFSFDPPLLPIFKDGPSGHYGMP